jgi:hypothetical protein
VNVEPVSGSHWLRHGVGESRREKLESGESGQKGWAKRTRFTFRSRFFPRSTSRPRHVRSVPCMTGGGATLAMRVRSRVRTRVYSRTRVLLPRYFTAGILCWVSRRVSHALASGRDGRHLRATFGDGTVARTRARPCTHGNHARTCHMPKSQVFCTCTPVGTCAHARGATERGTSHFNTLTIQVKRFRTLRAAPQILAPLCTCLALTKSKRAQVQVPENPSAPKSNRTQIQAHPIPSAPNSKRTLC